jgi:hypothetical protein
MNMFLWLTFFRSLENFFHLVCIKKKVIELQHAIVRELLGVWTHFFHIQAFS